MTTKRALNALLVGSSAHEVFSSAHLVQSIADELCAPADLGNLCAVNRTCTAAITWPHRAVEQGFDTATCAPLATASCLHSAMLSILGRAGASFAEASPPLAIDAGPFNERGPEASGIWSPALEALYRACARFRAYAEGALRAPGSLAIRGATHPLALDLLAALEQQLSAAKPHLRAITAHALAALLPLTACEARSFARIQSALQQLLADRESLLVREAAAASLSASLRCALKLRMHDAINALWVPSIVRLASFLADPDEPTAYGELQAFQVFGCIVDSILRSGLSMGDDQLHQFLRHAVPLERLVVGVLEDARARSAEGETLLAKLRALRGSLAAAADLEEIVLLHDCERHVTFVMEVSVYARLARCSSDAPVEVQLVPL